MTVLAWDGRYLVADGRGNRGDIIVSENTRKIETFRIPKHGKCAVAVCGVLHLKGPYLNHLREKGLEESFETFVGADEEGPYEMGALMVNEKGQCFEISSHGGWFEVTAPTALGSGLVIANHYLLQGSTALESVVQACKTVSSCGGEIMIYDSKARKLEILEGK